jgi:hypothetical protein
MFGASYTFMIRSPPDAKRDHTTGPEDPKTARTAGHPSLFSGSTIGSVALLGTRLYIGLDASAVTAAALAEGLGARRVRGLARVPLEPGALAPSPSGTNLLRADEVRRAVRRAAEGLGGRATLVLPDGVARVALVEVPDGADPREYVLFRLAPSLPFPAAEAIVDVLAAGGRRAMGAAVRRATVLEYEQAASTAGLEVERVHLAPLVALAGILRGGARDGVVHAVLGDVALCLAAFRGGVPVALRSRWRDRSPGEASRLRREASVAAALGGDGQEPVRLVCSGIDAERLHRELGDDPGPLATDLAGGPDAAAPPWVGGLVS